MEDFEGVLVTITMTRGSTPRNRGAWMWVSNNKIVGSIGGGAMEANVVERARSHLGSKLETDNILITLGPEMGQCCGGQVSLELQAANCPPQNVKRLAIFGAGHIGGKLARLARAIGFEVAIYDDREQIEIEDAEPYVFEPKPETRIETLSAGSYVVILTHDHGLDFRITERALLRNDLSFIGMIGSKSKAARFRSEYRALGKRLDALQSPIGQKTPNKHPEAVALSILTLIVSQSTDASQ